MGCVFLSAGVAALVIGLVSDLQQVPTWMAASALIFVGILVLFVGLFKRKRSGKYINTK